MTAEEEALITELENQFIDGLSESSVRLTPDYLVAWRYESLKSNWTGQPDHYWVMPPGYRTVEVSLPSPDCKRFSTSRAISAAIASLARRSPPYGPPFEHRQFLVVRRREQSGKRVEREFDWYSETDTEWEEAELSVRFVTHARKCARRRTRKVTEDTVPPAETDEE